MNSVLQKYQVEYLVGEVWRKGKDKKGKGKFHCSMEVKVGRGGRKGGNKGKLQKE